MTLSVSELVENGVSLVYGMGLFLALQNNFQPLLDISSQESKYVMKIIFQYLPACKQQNQNLKNLNNKTKMRKIKMHTNYKNVAMMQNLSESKKKIEV